MDEEFFFPQNVTTTYRIFGMGPRHLKRAGIGAAAAVPLVLTLAFRIGLFPALVVAAVLLAAYIGAVAYPTSGDETLSDVVLHLWAKGRAQTSFAYQSKEVAPIGEPDAPNVG